MDDVTRVFLCDDDPLVRAGLALILGGVPRFEIVGEAGDGQAAVDWVRRHRTDVVLMDLRMPVLDGIEATRQITDTDDPPKVIVLTTFDADDHVVRALEAGAAGFLLKDTPPPAIVEAIEKVVAGEPILSPSVTQRLIHRVTSDSEDGRRQRAAARLSALTEREREVARAIGRGRSNAEIAAELFMSVTTVKAHLTRIFAKLAVTNRVQVAILMHEAGELD